MKISPPPAFTQAERFGFRVGHDRAMDGAAAAKLCSEYVESVSKPGSPINKDSAEYMKSSIGCVKAMTSAREEEQRADLAIHQARQKISDAIAAGERSAVVLEVSGPSRIAERRMMKYLHTEGFGVVFHQAGGKRSLLATW